MSLSKILLLSTLTSFALGSPAPAPQSATNDLSKATSPAALTLGLPSCAQSCTTTFWKTVGCSTADAAKDWKCYCEAEGNLSDTLEDYKSDFQDGIELGKTWLSCVEKNCGSAGSDVKEAYLGFQQAAVICANYYKERGISHPIFEDILDDDEIGDDDVNDDDDTSTTLTRVIGTTKTDSITAHTTNSAGEPTSNSTPITTKSGSSSTPTQSSSNSNGAEKTITNNQDSAASTIRASAAAIVLGAFALAMF